MGQVRFHLPARMIGGASPVPPFYTRLMAGLAARGADVVVMARDYARLGPKPQGGDFDFVHNGGVARSGALNLGAAYLADFYYCDPKGLYFESSINEKPFHLGQLDPETSAAFFGRLQRDYIAPRRSRYDQPAATAAFGSGHIAVFLQDYSEPVARARYMDAKSMLRAVLADPDGRQVIVKPHPRNRGAETADLLQFLARKHPQVTVTDANLHDILAGAAVCVSICSSVAVEGMLHRVPAILFGRSDLHPCAQTVTAPREWPAALAAAMARDWPYAAFLHWLLRRHCVDIRSGFMDKIIARMVENGADLDQLGLKSADDDAAY